LKFTDASLSAQLSNSKLTGQAQGATASSGSIHKTKETDTRQDWPAGFVVCIRARGPANYWYWFHFSSHTRSDIHPAPTHASRCALSFGPATDQALQLSNQDTGDLPHGI